MTGEKYRRGSDLERAARKNLESNGYFVVRSAGSKGVADLVALKRGEVLLIQCKLDGYLTPGDRVALRTVTLPLGAVALVARWHKEGRAARTVAFYVLPSTGLPGYRPWTPDYRLERMSG